MRTIHSLLLVVCLGVPWQSASADVPPDHLATIKGQVSQIGGKYAPAKGFLYCAKSPGTVPGLPAHTFSFRVKDTKAAIERFVALKVDFPVMLDLYAPTNKDAAAILEQLSHLDNVHGLKLHGAFAADENLAYLARFKNLKVLELGCTPFLTKQGLRQLAHLDALEALCLYQCFKLTYGPAERQSLARLGNVQLLHVVHNSKVLFSGPAAGWAQPGI